jgi:serine palmitoyltransferase
LQGYAPLNSDFDSFYTRRLKARIDDCFNQPITGVAGRTVMILDRESHDNNKTHEFTGTRTRVLNISSYNYLGFAQARGGCADVVEECIKRYGVGSGGSRHGGGTLDLHLQAEALVAKFVGQDDATIVSMGFATNSTVIPAVVGKGCLVISDELNHASIRVGVRFSGASVRMFKHNNMKSLENLLREVISQGQPRTHRPWKKILLIVEGLYSMEGTMCNLPAILDLKRKYRVCLLHADVDRKLIISSSTSSWTRPTPSARSAPRVAGSATTTASTLGGWISSWARSPSPLALRVATSLA